MYIKSPNSKILVNNGRVVLCNTKNGGFVKTSQAYFNYLEKYLEENGGDFVKEEENTVVKNNAYRLFQELCKIRFYIPEEKKGEEESYSYQIIYLSLTNRCNLRCKHCVVSACIEEIDHMNTEEWKKVIDKVIILKPEQINLTGGEPLIRSDFCEILQYLRAHYEGLITLSTNALLINDDIVRTIKNNVDGVSVSLDGFDSHSCMKVRGEGVFEKVVGAIRRLKEYGIKNISVSMLKTSYTYGHEQEFFELCEELEVKPLIRRFAPTGRGEENQLELLPPIEGKKDVKGYNLQCALCQPGRKELSISENGDVYPCAPLSGNEKLLMGNLLDNSIEEILNNSRWKKELEKLRPWRMEKCKECSVNLFCHSCINFIIGMQSNEEIFQEYCNQQKKSLENILWRICDEK